MKQITLIMPAFPHRAINEGDEHWEGKDTMRIEIEGSVYYDIPELVKMLGLHKKTIYAWVQKGKLKPYKLGKKYLVSSDALKEFIESRKVGLTPTSHKSKGIASDAD